MDQQSQSSSRPPIAHIITRAPSPIRVQFQLLVYYIHNINRTDKSVLFSPLCLLSIDSESKTEILLIRLSNPQSVELNLYFLLLANNWNTSPFLRPTSSVLISSDCSADVKSESLSLSFIHSFSLWQTLYYMFLLWEVHRWAARAQESLKCRCICNFFSRKWDKKFPLNPKKFHNIKDVLLRHPDK